MSFDIWVSSGSLSALKGVLDSVGSLPTPYLVTAVKSASPPMPTGGVVLMLGSTLLKQAIAHMVAVHELSGSKDSCQIKRNTSLNSARGRVYSVNDAKVMFSFDPRATEIEPERIPELQWDLQLIARLASTGTIHPKFGRYQYVEDFAQVVSDLRTTATEKHPRQVACDLETIGLDPYAPEARVVSVSLTIEEGVSHVYYLPTSGLLPEHVRSQLEWILTSPTLKLVGANFKFDQVWMHRHFQLWCTNQTFDTYLVGSLLCENRSNSLNMHTKIYVNELGGYDDCVAPETPVLTADLRWVPVGSIQEGDDLVGFEEDCEPGHRRKLQTAKAESTKRLMKPGCLITFSDGRQIKCSQDHGFLAHGNTVSNGPYKWVRAYDLKPGIRVCVGAPVEAPATTYAAGYISGLYDGEGYVSYQGAGLTSGISQRPGIVWDKYELLMQAHGFGGYYARAKNGDGVKTSKHSGWPTLRLLQVFRPERLIAKRPYEGKCVPSGAPKITVQSVEFLDDIEVVSLQTSTHTFIANGICSHNSFNSLYDKSRMDLVPKDDLLLYAGGDTDACFRVANVQRKLLVKDKKLTNFYVNLLQPAATVFAKLESRGVVVDMAKYRELEAKCQHELETLSLQALALLPGKIRAKYADDLKLTRDVILREFLFTPRGLNLKPTVFTEKEKLPSCALDHLKTFMDHAEARPFIELLAKHSSVKKTLSTYIIGFMKHIRSDGRFHPTYQMGRGSSIDDPEAGTVTGRLSAKDPAYQTIPKRTVWAKPLRTVYVPPPGHGILKADYSQGELRITAVLAQEPTMIDAYRKGLDLHAITAAEIMGIPFDQFMQLDPDVIEENRRAAKAVNFGLIYGMGAEGLQDYSAKSYGVDLSIEQSETYIERFFKLYNRLPVWHETYKKSAYDLGYIRNPLGRIRHLPLIRSQNTEVKSRQERQAVNSPVQSCLSDAMLLAMVELDRRYPDLWMFGMTHDSLEVYIPLDDMEGWARKIRDVMENLPFERFGWHPPIKFQVDVEVGTESLATVKKLKLAA